MSINKPQLRDDWKPGFVEIAYLGYMLRAAREVATHSNDPDRQVGCVLALDYSEAVRSYRTVEVTPIMGQGCNTIPDGVALANKADHVMHAEQAACKSYAESFRKEHDTFTAFITRMPCLQCAQRLVDAHVKAVYFDAADERQSKWYNSFVSAARLLINEGVKLIAVSDTDQGFGMWPIRSHSELTIMFSEIDSVMELAASGVTVDTSPEAQPLTEAERRRENYVENVYDRARDNGNSPEDIADAEKLIAEYDAQLPN